MEIELSQNFRDRSQYNQRHVTCITKEGNFNKTY